MSIVNNALQKVVATLNALQAQGVQYEVRYDGNVYGGLPVPESEKKVVKRVRDTSIPHGHFTNTIRPLIAPMQVGEVVEIRMEGIELFRIQSAASSIGTKIHGEESCVTYQNAAKNCIEVLRLK